MSGLQTPGNVTLGTYAEDGHTQPTLDWRNVAVASGFILVNGKVNKYI